VAIEEQLKFLRNHGCDVAQDSLISGNPIAGEESPAQTQSAAIRHPNGGLPMPNGAASTIKGFATGPGMSGERELLSCAKAV